MRARLGVDGRRQGERLRARRGAVRSRRARGRCRVARRRHTRRGPGPARRWATPGRCCAGSPPRAPTTRPSIEAGVEVTASSVEQLEEILAVGIVPAPGAAQGRHRPVPQRRVRRAVEPARRGRGGGPVGRPARAHRHLVALRLRRRARAPGQRRAGEGVRSAPSRSSKAAGLEPGLRHLSNSAATLARPSAHLDLVRVGIASYGLPPAPRMTFATPLRPVMTLRGGSRPSSACRPARASPTATATPPIARRRSASCRSATPRACRAPRPTGSRSAFAGQRVRVGGTSAWTRSSSTSATCRPRAATSSRCSGRATTANPPRRSGRTPPIRSPTRSSRAWAAAPNAPTEEPMSMSARHEGRDHRRGLRRRRCRGHGPQQPADRAAPAAPRRGRRVRLGALRDPARSCRPTASASTSRSTSPSWRRHTCRRSCSCTASCARSTPGTTSGSPCAARSAWCSWTIARTGGPDVADRASSTIENLAADLHAVIEACTDRAGRARRPLDGRHDDHAAGRRPSRAVRPTRGRRGRAGQHEQPACCCVASPALRCLVPFARRVGPVVDWGQGFNSYSVVRRWGLGPNAQERHVDMTNEMILRAPTRVLTDFYPMFATLDVRHASRPCRRSRRSSMGGTHDFVTPLEPQPPHRRGHPGLVAGDPRGHRPHGDVRGARRASPS